KLVPESIQCAAPTDEAHRGGALGSVILSGPRLFIGSPSNAVQPKFQVFPKGAGARLFRPVTRAVRPDDRQLVAVVAEKVTAKERHERGHGGGCERDARRQRSFASRRR